MKLPIYLDYSATTPVDPRVAEKMMQFLTLDGTFGNPASRSHRFGWQAEEAVDIARNQIAELVGADPREIVFTSGATESDNLAIKGAANFYQKKGKHIITSKTEHKAVLDTCRQLEREGFDVTYLAPQSNGIIDLKELEAAMRDDTILVSIMPARVLFEITQGAELFLNPKAEYGKEFYPEEVAMLLVNGGVSKPVEHYIDKDSQILLGQPEVYPAAMVDALTTLFSQRKPVRRAFLALMHDRALDEKPNLLVGVEVDGDAAEIDALIQEAGSVASEALADDEPVDFCLVSEKERGVSHYLIAHTQPFYQRRWGSWLRNIIPSTDTSQ